MGRGIPVAQSAHWLTYLVAHRGPKHVVVDGSNLATEGRTSPSLKQLQEAVLSFIKEFPETKVTVVVDATFGHRIDKREVSEFNEAIDNNELVAPPAGAIGRGDGFVLTIAKKIGATVISNDSYQEFHADHTWLFDTGRLMGGKPVPHVGWVFIDRLPVRPSAAKSVKKASREASRPMPIPRTPPPNIKPAAKLKPQVSATPVAPAARAKTTAAPRESAKPALSVNELAPFLEFVEKHKVGSKVKGIIESYSAHGVYVRIGVVRGYLPLRLMSSPPPRSAREFVKVGQPVSLVVASFTASRRSIDVGIVGSKTVVATKTVVAAKLPAVHAPRKRAKKQKRSPVSVAARKTPAKKK
ncbi:MAG: S1 RNA-binding domain-containing protein [Actinobacteria bacterium]|nr:MAG: S1 RNA-binding domain-containing protein [Actinomycetota bacterium]